MEKTFIRKNALLRTFTIVSLIATVLIWLVLVLQITSFLEQNAVTRAQELSANFILREVEKEFSGFDLSAPKTEAADVSFAERAYRLNLGPNIFEVMIWNRDKTVIWSTDYQVIGRKSDKNNLLIKALEGKTASEISRLSKEEQSYEKRVERLLALYVPFNFDENGNPQNVIDVFQNLDPLYKDLRQHQQSVCIWTLLAFSILYLALFWIVRTASKRIDAQSEEIQGSYNIIENAKKEWEETFETINDAITIHDNDFNIIRANKAAEELLGLPYLTITKQKCYTSYHGTGCPPEGCPSCQTLKTGGSSTTELFEPNLNKYIEVKAIPRFSTSRELIGLIHIVRDITEHKKLEEQLRHIQKMEAIGTLAGGIAHDFNNVLNVIIGYSDILYRALKEDDPLRANVDEIIVASERAAHLTRSLLAFSRKEVVEKKPLNVNELVKGVEKMLSRIIGEDIDLSTRLSDKEMIVMADYGQIEQMLVNLATNARDAMPEGGLFIIETDIVELDKKFIEAYGYGTPGLYALISVTDTGIGMDKQIKTKIFEPFFTTKEVGKGTGLGLSIVYGTIKQHGGYINIYSEVGNGTTFKIYLPLSEANSGDTESAAANFVRGGSETILVAEDDKAILKLAESVLEQFGYRVISAVDGEDAVAKYMDNRGKIHLLLLDVMMPKKKGQEVYEEIKKFTPGIKVLFFSGYTADLLNKKGILDKEINFISKPVSINDLLRKVREVLDS